MRPPNKRQATHLWVATPVWEPLLYTHNESRMIAPMLAVVAI